MSNLQVSKAVITAAGRGARQYPAADTVQKAMLPLVDRDGLTKPVLQIIAEEAIESGIEEICVVCAPGDEAVYREHFRNYAANAPVDQGRPTGPRNRPDDSSTSSSGCDSPSSPSPRATATRSGAPGRSSATEPFLLLLSDHLYVSSESRRCARQLIELAAAEDCAVSAVQATREHLIHQYGTLAGRRLPEHPEIYVIDEIIEKPNPTEAELRLQVPGAPRGALPLLLRHARPDARGLRVARRPGPPRRPRAGLDPTDHGPECAWPVASVTSRWRRGGRGSISGSSSAWSRPRSPWPSPAPTGTGSSHCCWNRSSGSSRVRRMMTANSDRPEIPDRLDLP